MLLDTLRDLERAAQAGSLARTLRGKHLCLLGRVPTGSAAVMFRSAAQELGAQVTDLDPERLALASDSDIVRCGRMLGRLYDAVECEGVPPAIVDRLRATAGVPVYDGLAYDPRLGVRLSGAFGDGPPDQQRRHVLQAVLVSTLI